MASFLPVPEWVPPWALQLLGAGLFVLLTLAAAEVIGWLLDHWRGL